MDSLQINFNLADGGKAPARAHDGDAGWDLSAREEVLIMNGQSCKIHTGVSIEPSPEVWFLLSPRSSMFIQRKLMMIPTIIDTGYRGELFAVFYNTSGKGIWIREGDRICQLVPFAHVPIHWQMSMTLTESSRGDQGYGSTGR